VNQTANGVLELEQQFTFVLERKFILLETAITNMSSAIVDSLYYKISATGM